MWDWIVTLFNSCLNFIFRLLMTAFVLLSDLIISVFSIVLSFVKTVLDTVLSAFGAFDVSQYFSWLPADAVNVMSLIGLPNMLSMIVAALGIRVILQLIPFVRLGS